MSGLRDCMKYDMLISARLDGELSDEEARELDDHLASCEDCRRYLRLMEDVKEGLRENLPPPPDTLKSGVMYKIGLEKKRSKLVFGAFGRWTAVAAVICVVIFGAVRMGGSGVMQSAARPESAEVYKSGGSSASFSASLDAASAPAPAPTADEAPLRASASMAAGDGGAEAVLTAGKSAPDGAEVEEAPSATADPGYVRNDAVNEPSVYEADSLRGYEIGRSALGDGDYACVCIFYNALPEKLSTVGWLEQRPEEGELGRWLTDAETLRTLETEYPWNEFYYGDLSSGQGLVIVIAGEEE